MDKQLLFKRAKEAGFESCELYFVNKSDTTVMVSEGEVESHEISSSQAICFRGIIAEKMGYAYTEKIDEDAIEMLITMAKECAFLVEQEDREFIYSGEGHYEVITNYDESILQIDTNKHIEMALEIEKKAKEIGPQLEKIAECGVGIGTNQVMIMNSQGMKLEHKQTYISAYVEPVVKDGEAVVNGGEMKTCTSLSALDLDELAKEAVRNTLRQVGANAIPSGKYKVVFENEMMSTLLNVMQSSFFADVMQDGKSLLKGKVGEIIASNKVNIIDNPHLVGGLGSRGFDDEGVPTKKKYLVNEGKFLGFLHNLKTAYKEGVETTGNASKGSIAAPVKVASTNLYLEAGTVSLEALLEQAEEGIYITNLEGVHAGANPITGDFSLAAKGMFIEKGKLTTGIKQIIIAGNFFELVKNIVEVANDLKMTGCIGSPSVLVREISVAGK